MVQNDIRELPKTSFTNRRISESTFNQTDFIDSHFAESFAKYQLQSPDYAPSIWLAFDEMIHRVSRNRLLEAPIRMFLALLLCSIAFISCHRGALKDNSVHDQFNGYFISRVSSYHYEGSRKYNEIDYTLYCPHSESVFKFFEHEHYKDYDPNGKFISHLFGPEFMDVLDISILRSYGYDSLYTFLINRSPDYNGENFSSVYKFVNQPEMPSTPFFIVQRGFGKLIQGKRFLHDGQLLNEADNMLLYWIYDFNDVDLYVVKKGATSTTIPN